MKSLNLTTVSPVHTQETGAPQGHVTCLRSQGWLGVQLARGFLTQNLNKTERGGQRWRRARGGGGEADAVVGWGGGGHEEGGLYAGREEALESCRLGTAFGEPAATSHSPDGRLICEEHAYEGARVLWGLGVGNSTCSLPRADSSRASITAPPFQTHKREERSREVTCLRLHS